MTIRPCLRVAAAGLVLGVALLAACRGGGPTSRQTPPGPARAAAGPVVVTGHGWSARAGIGGPVPASGSCRTRQINAEPLPDPRCTPGAIDSTVTQANLHTTVCRPGGYTSTIRPPAWITTPIKKVVMATYGIPWSEARRVELGHLVELSAGGASDVRNLWPEPNQDAYHHTRGQRVHNDKDADEAAAHDALCAGRISLAAVQRAFASNWTTAATVLHLTGDQP